MFTVQDYVDGRCGDTPVYLHTAWGDLLVTGFRRFSDGPVIVTGKGIYEQWFTVCWHTRLKTEQEG